MKAPLLYRIASVFLVLFAAGHTFGFRKSDPTWKVESVVAAMQAVHFTVDGFDRTYWDLFSGLGFSSTFALVFFAIFAWQLARVPATTRREIPVVLWSFAGAFVGMSVVAWMYIAMIPAVFASVTALILIAAASAARKS